MIIVAAMCALFQACGPVDPQRHFPDDGDLELMLRYLVDDGEARGIVLGVLEADGFSRIVSYGNAGDGGPAIDSRSSFEIGSVTKLFTSTLLAEMVERGKVALDDPVSKYLPSAFHVPTFGDRAITLEDLATHTSGLSDPVILEQLSARGVDDPYSVSVDMLYEVLSQYELQRMPGTEFEYSNAGMGLLGHVLAQAAGSDLKALMKSRVLDPLGMGDTQYGVDGIPAEQVVQGHHGTQVVAPTVVSEALEGAGGLRSTVEDMLRFLAASAGVVDSELRRPMLTTQEPRHPMGAGNRSVGLGWWISTLNHRPLIQHDGDTDGFTVRIAFDPDRRVGMVVMANSREFDNTLVPDLIVHSPITVAEEPMPPRSYLAGLTGTYYIDRHYWYVRLDDDGFLTLQPTTDVRMRLYPVSDTLFFTKREEWSFAFPTDTTGEAPEIVFFVNGRPRNGVRVANEAPSPRTIAGNEGLPLDDAMVARYEGAFDVPLGRQTLELTVYKAETTGRLMSNFGGTLSRLIPLGEDQFTLVYNPSVRLGFTVQDGQAETITLNQGDRSDTGVRRH
jgi:CubicO group peptidase (beta-lactamase class C family)